MITSDQLKDVNDRTDALYRYLDIDSKRIELEEEKMRTQAPDFWEDPKRAQEQMKKVKGIECWVNGYDEVKHLTDELSLAVEFFHDEMVSEQEVDDDYAKAIKAIEDLEMKNMLRQDEDPMDAVMKINSGAGGTESQDWAQMLMRMYMRWAEAHNYKVTISDLQEGDEAGIKSVTMEIEGGEYAYGFLKSENGVHRLGSRVAVQRTR
jgi:peptide chain release factor 2